MHTCAPPTKELKKCFKESAKVIHGLGHTLLEQEKPDDGSLSTALKPYFESAHFDARQYFHEYIGIDLYPGAATGAKPLVSYPGSLSPETRRGLFGEVLAGLLTESYTYIGGHTWIVPVFLFRDHQDVRNYLFELDQNPHLVRKTLGRQGTDFVGISLNSAGEVVRVISGEAKWRTTLNKSVVETLLHGEKKNGSGKGILQELNNEPNLPLGVRQLQEILKLNDPEKFDKIILCLQEALTSKKTTPFPKTNLIVIAGNRNPERDPGDCFIPNDRIPAGYKADSDLQVMEVVFKEGKKLIDKIYESLWQVNEDA